MPIAIDTTSPLPVADKDFGYAVVITASGGVGAHQWTRLAGSVPPGLVLDVASTSGSISLSGTPTTFGTYSFTLRVQDSLGTTTQKTFQIEVKEKAQLVSFGTRLVNPATGLGVQAQAITAEVYDVQHQLRDTFVFPTGMVESTDSGGVLYTVHDYSVSDRTRFKGNFLHIKWTAVFAGNALNPWWEMVPLTSVIAPTIDANRQPYASLVEATRYFDQLFDKRERWATYNEREVDQLLALVSASDQIDMEKFKGYRLRVFEALAVLRQFPRIMPWGERTRGLVGDSQIPVRIMNACCEQALWLLEQRQSGHDMDMRQFLQHSGLTGITRGTQQEAWDLAHAQHSKLCPTAYRLLQPLLAVGIDDTPGLA